MCREASLIITKQGVKWSRKTDSHEEIIREHGLKDEVAGKITLVRVEITPPDGDFSKPLELWEYRVDQDLLPEWYEKNPDKWEQEARAALVDWAAAKVFTSGSHEIREGKCWAYNSSQVTAYNSSQVTAYGSSQVTAYNSSQVKAYGSSQVTAYNSSQVKACGSSQVTAYGSSQVTAYGSSNSVIYSCKSFDLSENAAAIDRRGSKVVLLTATK